MARPVCRKGRAGVVVVAVVVFIIVGITAAVCHRHTNFCEEQGEDGNDRPEASASADTSIR